jgi:hypothetical protein
LTIILMGFITIIVPWQHRMSDQPMHDHHSLNSHGFVAPIAAYYRTNTFFLDNGISFDASSGVDS